MIPRLLLGRPLFDRRGRRRGGEESSGTSASSDGSPQGRVGSGLRRRLPPRPRLVCPWTDLSTQPPPLTDVGGLRVPRLPKPDHTLRRPPDTKLGARRSSNDSLAPFLRRGPLRSPRCRRFPSSFLHVFVFEPILSTPYSFVTL